MTAGLEWPPSLWPALHRSASGEGWPPSGPETADRLVREATRHGLLPLLFEARGLPEVVDVALDRARAWRRIFALRSEGLDLVLARVGRLLGPEPWIALKGADYRCRLYPKPWLRPMLDVDVLVPPDRMDAACARLGDGGFRQEFPGGPATRARAHHERVLRCDDLVVELHQSFIQRSRHRIDYAAVWERRVPVELGGVSATRLSDPDALLFQALSMAVDAFAGPWLRHVDLWLMLRLRPGVLAEAAGRAREWQARHALYGALRQQFAVFPESSSETAQAIARGLLGRPARVWLDLAVLPTLLGRGRERDVGRGARLWRKYWLLDNVRRRVGFAVSHVAAVLEGWRLARRSRSSANGA